MRPRIYVYGTDLSIKMQTSSETTNFLSLHHIDIHFDANPYPNPTLKMSKQDCSTTLTAKETRTLTTKN